MVGPSKILTVSYGTFSCTLEGFDEPFSTMKAIAEYFRDLAADDRYFGAEPPTPDAQMLHKIAERELQRHVVAKVSDHGVVLRQQEATSEASTTEASTTAAQPLVTPQAPEEAVAEVVETAAPVVEQATIMVAEAPVAAEPAPIAEIETREADVALEVEAAEVETQDEDYSVSLDSVMAAVAPAPAEMVEDFDLPNEAYDEDETEDTIPAPVLHIVAETAPAEDSIAAKLMRIRAVVEEVRAGAPLSFDAEETAEIEPSPEVSEEFGFAIDMGGDVPALAAAEAERAAQRAMADAAADLAISGTLASELEAEPQASFEDEDEYEDDFDGEAIASDDEFDDDLEDEIEDELVDSLQDDDGYDDEEQLADADADADTSDDDALLSTLSNLASDTNAAIVDAPAATASSATFEAAVQRGRASPAFDDLSVSDTAAESEAAAPAPARSSIFERARASVIRLGRGRGRSEEETPESEEVAEAEDIYRPSYPIDEALMVQDDDYADEELLENGDEPEVARLMDEAKEKLEGAESRRRFSAISHLKAAVAATLADRQMKPGETAAATPTGEATEEISLYREDLSKAVRPRRPAADSAPSTPRPNLELRPAPLVLVSEQRIDRPDQGGAEGIAIRPRRISAGNLALNPTEADDDIDEDGDLSPEDASSFAEFAERLGASSLSELLEAAAAYTASVEGQESFTRPQLMRKVEFVSSRGEYNREDGLRSFGMLLRQGKIQKVAKGQFAITDASKFMTEARRIAG